MVMSKEELLLAARENGLYFLWRDETDRNILVFCGILPNNPTQGFLFKYNLSDGSITTRMKHPEYRHVTELLRQGLSDEEVLAVCRKPRMHTDVGIYLDGKESKINMNDEPFQLSVARRVEIMEEKLKERWSSIAIGSSGCVICLKNGRYWRIGNIPQKLFKSLRKAKHKVIYCVIGSDSRYFVRYSNGIAEYTGSKEFTEGLLNSGDKSAVCVTFGPTDESYFILYDDGSTAFSGLPSQLEALLSERDDVQRVSLGWQGEWFVKFKKYWKCHHFSEEIRERLEGYKEQGVRIENIIFGKDTFVIQYSEADD